jgi:aminoglycoside phosphotransferase (APT) family kinase protein
VARDRDLVKTRSDIETWLRTQLPQSQDLAVSELRSAAGGLSSETLFCSVTWNEGPIAHAKRLVLRIRPDGHQVIPDPDPMLQYNLMQALGERSDVPVPGVWLADSAGAAIGAPCFFMEEVKGTILSAANPQPANPTDAVPPPRWSASELGQIYDNALKVLSDLHKVDCGDAFEFLAWPGATALDGTLSQVTRWYEFAKRGRALGVIDVAMQWVVDHKPENPDRCVCWGDARPGNLIIAEDLSVATVLDWEMAVLGPPEVDVGWWLMFEEVAFNRFQIGARPEGVPDREGMIAAYEEHSGRALRDIRYYEILAAFRLACINVRLLELGAYGPMAAAWTLESTDDRMIINDPFTSLLADWLGLDVWGAPAAAALV